MKTLWVVVADHKQARIFRADAAKKRLEQLHDLNHSAARHEAEAVSSESHGSASSDKFYAKREGEQFVGNLTSLLEEQLRQKHFESLMIFCPATFLGEFRKARSVALEKTVDQENAKDLTHQGIKEIEKAVFG